MREMSTLLKHKHRRRSSSCSSPDSHKVSHKVSNSETSASKYDKEMLKRRHPSKLQFEELSDSSSGRDNDKNSGKKRKKHSHHRKLDVRDSESEEENLTSQSKIKTSKSRRENERPRHKTDEDRSRAREKENSRCNHKKEQHLSSEYKSSDHTRRRERHYEDDGGHKRDNGGGGRHSDKRLDSGNSEKRAHNNDRYQEHRDEGHNRRRNDGNDRRESNRQLHEGEDKRKRWRDGGEVSRSGGSRGHGGGSNEGNQLTGFDRNRPIKQEPGLNDNESENYEWGSKAAPGVGINIKKEKETEKDKPNFGLSGKLAEDTNMVNGVVIKYSEPPEARKPRRRWRLYVFKGEENLPTLYLHRQSAFLIGRDRKVVDIPVDHPSCSKQHAAFQFRLVPYQRPNGTMGKRVRPYIIDLESSNGTFVNNNRIDSKKYVELLERDVMKFGFSSREYVLLHEQSKESDGEDDDAVGT